MIAVGLYVFASLVLRYTGFGRAVYAVGSNSDAASLTGINVKLVQVTVYTSSGVFRRAWRDRARRPADRDRAASRSEPDVDGRGRSPDRRGVVRRR